MTSSKVLKFGGRRRPIGIDLFAGAGGLSLGFEQAGFDVVAAVEIDPIHSAVHEFNFPNCITICRSVTAISGQEIRELAGIGKAEIDVVFGGAPCQGFSMIGKRALDDPRNELVHHFVRLVAELSPRYFVFENVKGVTVGNHKQFLNETIDAFIDAGYDVVEEYRVLNAADYGVPQDRKRLFLMGARRGLPLPSYPAPETRTTVWVNRSGIAGGWIDQIYAAAQFMSDDRIALFELTVEDGLVKVVDERHYKLVPGGDITAADLSGYSTRT